MSKVEAVRYEAGRAREWDEFVARARNGHFLFRRGYMDYHADRFPDASLMFEDEAGRLVGLLPATEVEGRVIASHAGLTFGGLVSSDSTKAALTLEIFDAMLARLRSEGYARLVYKAVPHIYHRAPCEEDLYALFRAGARLVRRDLSSTLDMRARLPFSKGRKYSMKLAAKGGVAVSQSDDFETFMAIEERVLAERHGARPVHTAAELRMLAGRFPENIKLFAAGRGGRMLAGVVVYESEHVAHAQYIGASAEGREVGAADLILGSLIEEHYTAKRFFDFGISTERAGTYLNEGLAENKQGFGARAVVYDFYELEL
jgi:Acetyltransferase (GNAT) domain